MTDDFNENYYLNSVEQVPYQKTVQTHILSGVYNSTGAYEEIDEKVFISNGKLQTETDMNAL